MTDILIKKEMLSSVLSLISKPGKTCSFPLFCYKGIHSDQTQRSDFLGVQSKKTAGN